MISRKACIDLMNASHLVGRLDFAHAVAIDWLASWPGDLEMQLLLAETELAQGAAETAAKRLKRLIIADPAHARAYEVLSNASQMTGDPNAGVIYSACYYALKGRLLPAEGQPAWVGAMANALQALRHGQPDDAAESARKGVSAEVTIPLPTLVLVGALMEAGDVSAAFAIARSGHDRWPEAIPFRLYMAREMLAKGEGSRAVEYLHQAAAEDSQGRIARAVLGPDHPYQDLWPKVMLADLSRPVPAKVHIAMGENRLPGRRPSARARVGIKRPSPSPRSAGRPADPESSLPTPEPWEAFRGPDSGDAYASANPDFTAGGAEVGSGSNPLSTPIDPVTRRGDEENRIPAYVVLSSRTRLLQAFSEAGFNRIDAAVDRLIAAAGKRPKWRAYKIYVDDPRTLKAFDLSPVDPANAWQVKLRLADLDSSLKRRGEMVGAVLIVGGHRIVPFHMLPNPVDDDDDAIPSDNPYSITDENYFIPEWPVGRLPSDNNPELIVDLLDRSARHHAAEAHFSSIFVRLQSWLRMRFGGLLQRNREALGYSASIWRKASMAVFRSIGEPRELITSPPTEAGRLPSVAFRPTRFSYFNLHGLEDEPEWFGQRDPLRDEGYPLEFPIALEPRDVVDGGRAPRVVYSEACYGANPFGKTSDTSLCLKFMQSGTQAFIGSTKISYGAVTPPLIAADLLGRGLWQNVRASLPVGEALRRAKLGLVTEMNRRQGYLDGEDQKTLISFVLFGDPLFAPFSDALGRRHKGIIRSSRRPGELNTTCALGGQCSSEDRREAISIEAARAIVARYLPGMSDSVCRIRPQFHACEGEGHRCPTHQLGGKEGSSARPNTVVVTFEKHVQEGPRRHAHFARLTVDSGGKMLKLAVSR